MPLEHAVLLLALAVILSAAVRDGRAWASTMAPDATTRGVLLAIGLSHALAVMAWAPHAPWHGNRHGIERLAWLAERAPGEALLVTNHGFHGQGWYVLWGLLDLFPGGSPYTPNILLSAATTLGVFTLLRGLGADRVYALVFTALHAWLPMRLRMAPTLSLYVGAEFALVGALAATLWWVRRPSVHAYAGALAWVVLAMHQHLEMLAVTPLVIAAFVFPGHARTWWDVHRGDRRVVGCTIAAVLAMGPRLWALWTLPGALPGPPGGEQLRAITVAILLLLGLSPLRRMPTPWRQGLTTAVVVGLTIAMARTLRATWAPLPVPFVAIPDGLPQAPAQVHAFFAGHVTPVLPATLAAVGLVWPRASDRETHRLVVRALTAIAVFHAGVWDNPTTYLRAGLPELALLTALAWLGARRALATIPAPMTGRGTIACLLPVVVMPWLTHRPVWQHTYPQQQDALLLAWTRHAELGTVYALSDLDPIGAEGFATHHRAYVRAMLPEAQPLSALLERGADAIGHHVLLGATCSMPLPHADISRHNDIYVGGRVWRTGEGDTWNLPSVRADLWPCWHQLDAATCAVDGEPCPSWTCPSPTQPVDPEPWFIDPACAAVHAQFVLRPLREAAVAPGNLAEFDVVLEPSMPMGVYEIVDHRGPAVPPG